MASFEILTFKTLKSSPSTEKWHQIKASSPDPNDDLNAKLDAEEQAVAETEETKTESKSRLDHSTLSTLYY